MNTTEIIKKTLKNLSIDPVNQGVSDGMRWFGTGKTTSIYSPIDGFLIAKVKNGSGKDYEITIKRASEAFTMWREVPAPKRGDVVRQLGDILRKYKNDLGRLVTIEMGKSIQEGLDERKMEREKEGQAKEKSTKENGEAKKAKLKKKTSAKPAAREKETELKEVKTEAKKEEVDKKETEKKEAEKEIKEEKED